MFGIRLIFLLAVLGGVIAFIADKLGSKIGKKKLRIFGLRPHDTSVLLTIAFIADKLGSKIGKKKLRIFGLRPHDTSVLLTVLSGVLISLFSMGILAVSSESARTALFGMEKLQKELQQLNTEKGTVEEEYNKAMASLQEKNEAIAGLDLKIKESNAAQAAAEKSLQQANENLSAVQGQYQETQGAPVSDRSP